MPCPVWPPAQGRRWGPPLEVKITTAHAGEAQIGGPVAGPGLDATSPSARAEGCAAAPHPPHVPGAPALLAPGTTAPWPGAAARRSWGRLGASTRTSHWCWAQGCPQRGAHCCCPRCRTRPSPALTVGTYSPGWRCTAGRRVYSSFHSWSVAPHLNPLVYPINLLLPCTTPLQPCPHPIAPPICSHDVTCSPTSSSPSLPVTPFHSPTVLLGVQ